MHIVNSTIGFGLVLAGLYFFVRLFTTWRQRGKRKGLSALLSAIGCALIGVQYLRYGAGSIINLPLLVTGSCSVALAATVGAWAEWESWSAAKRISQV